MDKIQMEADEHVLIQMRKHWFVIAVQMLGVVTGALIPVILYAVLMYAFTHIGTVTIPNIPVPFLIAVYAIWLLLMWMALFNIWTNYYLDIWTITNKRIIVVDQKRLFSRSTGSFRLDRLQDINVEINGFIATFLNFGTIEAETASGSDDEFKATGLPDPRELKSIILKATDDLMRSYNNGASVQNGNL